MVAYDPRYEYARGLVKFNAFLRATRYDWDRRHWLGRTIKEGYACLQPDTYHPKMLRELFRYMLQLDHDELVRTDRAGTEPMFQMLPPEMIVAIDAIWSLNGFAKPFSAWADYRDIFERGIRYDIPEIEPFKETPLPPARFLYVGDDDEGLFDTGMRDAYYEGLTEMSGRHLGLREVDGGPSVWDLGTGQSFAVHSESAHMLMQFEMESMLSKHDREAVPGGVTSAYKFYIQYGAIELSHGQLMAHDDILRRTALKDRLGLSYDYDIKDLLGNRSVGFDDLPEAAKHAWAHKEKAAKALPPKIRQEVIRFVETEAPRVRAQDVMDFDSAPVAPGL